MITATINIEQVRDWLVNLPDQLRRAVLSKSQTLAEALQQKASEKLNGEVLQSKTGTLRDSITNETTEDGDTVGANVSTGDVPYAGIQEYGGTTKSHIIESTQGKVLAFPVNGKQSFFRYVQHPGSVIPEHSYLRSSLNDMQDDIIQGMSDSVPQ